MRILKIKTYEVLVDDEDFDLVNQYSWKVQKQKSGNPAGAFTKHGTVSMHRLLMRAAEGDVIDHVDGNPLNNRRQNLRFCTLCQNQWNRRRGVNNTSGHKGVYYDNRSQRWIASIRADRKRMYLGSFVSADDAGAAYRIAAQKYHGEFYRPA